jgi:hypothetical protein
MSYVDNKNYTSLKELQNFKGNKYLWFNHKLHD